MPVFHQAMYQSARGEGPLSWSRPARHHCYAGRLKENASARQVRVRAEAFYGPRAVLLYIDLERHYEERVHTMREQSASPKAGDRQRRGAVRSDLVADCTLRCSTTSPITAA